MDDMAKDVRNMTCCFTGHRYLPMSEIVEVADRLEKTVAGLIRNGVRYFGSGGALGFDTDTKKFLKSTKNILTNSFFFVIVSTVDCNSLRHYHYSRSAVVCLEELFCCLKRPAFWNRRW